MKKSRRHLIYDPLIIPRIKLYLEENTHQNHVTVSDMSRTLQAKYRDYGRRKVAPFRQLVEHAYQIVLQSYGLGSNSNSDVEGEQSDGSIELLDEDSENEESSAAPATTMNLLGDAMNSLYNKKPSSAPVTGTATTTGTVPEPTPAASSSQKSGKGEPAPIDISSDEELNDKELDDVERYILPQVPSGINLTRVQPTTTNGVATNKNAEKRVQQNEPEGAVPQQIRKKRKLGPIQAPSLSLIKPASTAAAATKKTAPKKDYPTKTSTLTFADVGGLDKILKELCELLLHLKHPELYEHIGLTAPRGFLLHGPPGSGKTLLANAIAGQLKVPLIEVAATELVGGISGESEERIREVFEKAVTVAPCVLFIDEVDVISANRNNAQKDLERRIVSQLLSSLDSLGHVPNGSQVVVIGATNRADTLDPALRRVGRFDQEICLGIPDRKAREQVLRILCKTIRLEEPFSYDELAVLTPGYVGADLLALAMRAATIAVKRAFSAKGFQEEPPTVPDTIVLTGEEEDKEKVVEMNGHETEAVEERMDVDAGEVVMAATKETGEPVPVTSNNIAEELEKESPIIASAEEKPVEAIETDQMVQDKDTNDKKEEISPKGVTVPRQHTLEEMIEWLNSDKKTPLTKEDIEALRVTMADFKAALLVVQPSAKREGFITVPDVTWDDIGSLGDIRDELKLAILAPVKYPRKLEQLGLQSPSGVLLCGPPGCGKTLLAKAVANEAGINFISVKGPELLNMYVGESERAVRQCFQRAKNSAPCVIFFDEFDALCPKRSNRSENSSGARVVNQLLTEMDGVEDRRGVFLMAATNRPDMIDGAVLRPGRLDKILYVGLPEAHDREDILRALTKGGTKPQLGEDVCFKKLSELAAGFTGADLGGLVREASLQALKESLLNCEEDPDGCDVEGEKMLVKSKHFVEALRNIKPSVTEEDKRNYERLQKQYGTKEPKVVV